MKIFKTLFFYCTILVFLIIGCKDDESVIEEQIIPTVADFTFIVNDSQLATFTNNSENATSYKWDFGDGNSSHCR